MKINPIRSTRNNVSLANVTAFLKPAPGPMSPPEVTRHARRLLDIGLAPDLASALSVTTLGAVVLEANDYGWQRGRDND